ncbi:MAG: peptide-methionine (R)-S-oxide reductase MsrB [Gammaproteobacteria bacterium AqS3]|nr:peptide-methionine (R)-S-oxide reductase MsrB [Gammaproteobacteria bacterium AqS3]
MPVSRRRFARLLALLIPAIRVSASSFPGADEWRLSPEEWRERLTSNQFYILRDHGTERPWTSPLNDEERTGSYHCAGCDLLLFSSEHKYDSGTGWPSFWRPAEEDHLGTQADFKMIWPRTEYHCARCLGHQGHVFDDGPRPTGKRYCNNGYGLIFRPQI